ncbi:MAG: DUF3107 family protein [Candidatus Fonsibacter sp.]
MATKSKTSKTEVRIGISDSNQELNIECANSQDEVVKSVSEALNSNQTLQLANFSRARFSYRCSIKNFTKIIICFARIFSQTGAISCGRTKS